FHTGSVGIAIGTFVGLATHLAPGTLFTRLVLNMIGVVLVFEGIRSLWHLHIAAATATGTGSDAAAMSQLSSGHPMHWAFLYSAVAALILFALYGVVIHIQ
ncbi:MAG: M50 family metallopeptidase, partial [Deltaproteobacteria bacterium]|nr:M50 family metallopeptidase [Deltaproteobacteria bacterium]